VLLFAAITGAQPPAPTHKIVTTDRQTVSATITSEIQTTSYAVSRWLVFLPEPPELPSQTKVKVTASPAGKVVTEKSPLARKVRLIDIHVPKPVLGAKLELKMEVQAVLRERKLVPLGADETPPKVTALTSAERKYYTAPSDQIDFDAQPFKDWLDKKDLRLKKDERPLELAARILEVIRADYDYRFDPKEDKKASAVCERTSGDCGGMTYLFVAVMRANKVPARALVGRFAKPRADGARPGEPGYDQPHVRAEVYLADVGWVPVDPSFANGFKRKPVTAFIGEDTGDMLVLHVDVDLRLPYPDKERTAQAIQIAPHYWSFGKGTFDGTFGPSGWDAKTTPIEKK
jgi:transglutaminase-like putative cysteine protease